LTPLAFPVLLVVLPHILKRCFLRSRYPVGCLSGTLLVPPLITRGVDARKLPLAASRLALLCYNTYSSMTGSIEGERPRGELTPGQNQSPREGGADYSAMLSSIRAEQDVETFVADLRQHKEQLLSLTDKIVDEREDPWAKPQIKHVVADYLGLVLRQHILNIDIFGEIELIGRTREERVFNLTRVVPSAWLYDHPDSEAAKAVSVLGIYASPAQHQRLLQEMWSTLLPIITGHSKNKE